VERGWSHGGFDVDPSVSGGGIWCEDGAVDSSETSDGLGYSTMIGAKIVLECLKLMTEDCTDSDFNSRISTVRRNDVLTGMNEVKGHFLPLVFSLLSGQYSLVCSAKGSLKEMEKYLVNNGRMLSQINPEEKSVYDAQIRKRDCAGRLVADCLGTIEKFCQSMPLDWITISSNGCDFVSALLHLLREDVAQIRVLSVLCLEQLVLRKLEYDHWWRFISSLPTAVTEANDIASQNDTLKATVEGKELNKVLALVDKLTFHRSLSRMLSGMVSAHIANISVDKEFTKEMGPKFQSLAAYLNLMADLVSHPSGLIASEQTSVWIALMREPQISKSQTNILRPYLERVLNAHMTHIIRIRWDDVEDQTHPLAPLLDEAWYEREEYEDWLSELRSKASQLFKLIGNTVPELAVSAMKQKVRYLLTTYGEGGLRDHIDPATNHFPSLIVF